MKVNESVNAHAFARDAQQKPFGRRPHVMKRPPCQRVTRRDSFLLFPAPQEASPSLFPAEEVSHASVQSSGFRARRTLDTRTLAGSPSNVICFFQRLSLSQPSFTHHCLDLQTSFTGAGIDLLRGDGKVCIFSCVMDGFCFMEIRKQKSVFFSFLAHKELSLKMDC